MEYKEMIEKMAGEILGTNTEDVDNTDTVDDAEGTESMEVNADEYNEYVVKLAEEMLADDEVEKEAEEEDGAEEGNIEVTAEEQEAIIEKCATAYNEAQLLKQAAEEAYGQAQAMEDAAVLAYNSLIEEE